MIFSTRDWTDAAIVYTHASGAATYTVSGDVLNPYDVAVALRAWLDDAARPWAAAISAVALSVDDDGAGRRRFVFAFTGSTPTFVSVVPNATWIARFGDTSQSPPAACPSSCSVVPASGLWERVSSSRGLRTRAGSMRMEPANVSHRRPRIELAMDRTQAFTLGAAVRAASTSPRQAYVYDEMTSTWRLVSCGELKLEHFNGDALLVVGSLEAVGGL